jgi:hypothetical protein
MGVDQSAMALRRHSSPIREQLNPSKSELLQPALRPGAQGGKRRDAVRHVVGVAVLMHGKRDPGRIAAGGEQLKTDVFQRPPPGARRVRAVRSFVVQIDVSGARAAEKTMPIDFVGDWCRQDSRRARNTAASEKPDPSSRAA